MTTGNKIVDEISALHINSIPEAWYRTVVRNNQPHAMAILVLWDLVYWYKWTEVRDEASGMVVSYKKKFKADLLQRSYDAIAVKFGITKRQATDIIVFLEKLGALKRVFRNIKVANTTLSNVLFIELVPSVIKDLSHVELGEVSQFDGRGSHTDMGEGLTDSGETYTTSSTTNTTTNINSSPTKLESEPPKLSDFTNNESQKKVVRPKKPTKTEQTEQYLSSLSNEVYAKSHNCADKLVNYLIKLQNSTTAAKNLKPWQRDFAMFASAENKSFDEIINVIDFVFNDDWWSSRVSSAQMIIKNYGMLYQRMRGFRGSSFQKSLERTNMDTGKRDYDKSLW